MELEGYPSLELEGVGLPLPGQKKLKIEEERGHSPLLKRERMYGLDPC